MAREKGADEIFCRACGVAIKKQAEHCPECGTRNTGAEPNGPAVAHQQSSPTQQVTMSEELDSAQPTKAVPTSDRSAIDTIALYAGWIGGVFLLVMGLSTFLDSGGLIRRLLSGIVFVAGGVIALPLTRDQLQPKLSQYGIILSRAAIVGIAIFALFAGALLAPP